MERIKSILFAIAMLLATPAFFTSCQEDAPEINYTMNVSVINDFTKVVEAINNGFLKNEEAIKKLTEAIDKMNADQQTKLQVIIDVLNSVNATLETKLAAIEAAMKAQTLTLESKLTLLETAIKNQTLRQEEMAGKLITAIENLQGDMQEKIAAIAEAINNVNTTLQSKLALIEATIKAQTLSLEAKLGLIEAAIKALPDYSSQLAAIQTAIENLPDYGDKIAAIEAAIKAMPNYNDKFDAVVAALNAMKAQVETLGQTQEGVKTEINNTATAINKLIEQVQKGDAAAASALKDIVKKLEELKEKIGSGSSGGSGGSGGGTGNEDDEYGDDIDFNNVSFANLVESIDRMNTKGFELHEGIFFFKTNEGRIGKAIITSERTHVQNLLDDSSRFLLHYVLYETNGKVCAKKTIFRETVHGVGHPDDLKEIDIDLDTGVEGGFGVDFHFSIGVKHYSYDHIGYDVINKVKITTKNNAKAVIYLKR